MKDVTSVSLLRRVRDTTDDESWRQFANLYQKLIRRWLTAQGLQPQDADDVQQEVMACLHREMPRFEHSGRSGAFRKWLRQMTVNRLREFWRKRDRRRLASGPDVARLADQLADDDSGLSRLWREEHDRFVLGQLLAMIEGKFQPKSITAFRAIVLQQRPAREVADELGMTLGAARVAQSRVLRALRQLGEGLID